MDFSLTIAECITQKHRLQNKLELQLNTFHAKYPVETHRRHLLQKFKAANIAEMIKLATKLFWLE